MSGTRVDLIGDEDDIKGRIESERESERGEVCVCVGWVWDGIGWQSR